MELGADLDALFYYSAHTYSKNSPRGDRRHDLKSCAHERNKGGTITAPLPKQQQKTQF